MPAKFRPGSGFEVVLSGDRDMPEDQRSTFIARVLTYEESKVLQRVVESVDKAKADKDMPFASTDELFAILEKNITGWRHMTDEAGGDIGYGPGLLSSIVSLSEGFELLGLLTAQGIGAAERKKSESPSDCSTD